jgi:hypothetical protein
MGGREAKTRRYTIGAHGSPWTPTTARTGAERLGSLVAQPVLAQDAVGPDIISPLMTGRDRKGPTITALVDSGASITPPQRKY